MQGETDKLEFLRGLGNHSIRTCRGHHHQKAFAGEHKVYPLHVLFTTNYKLPPDLDRCNLEKHLSDADFEMAFNVARDDLYRMPIWKRNDLKKRVRLF